MVKIRKKYLLFIAFILTIICLNNYKVLAATTTKIIDFKTGDEICNAVKTNSRIKIYVSSYYDNKNYLLKSSESNCVNADSFSNVEANIKNGKTVWTAFGRDFYSNQIVVDDVLIKDKKKYGEHSPFSIRNGKKDLNNLKSSSTLNPGEKIFFTLNVDDKNLKSDTYKSLILKIEAGYVGDINVYLYNSISYYVYTNDKTYGPYSLDYAEKERIEQVITSTGSKANLTVNTIVSSNLLEGIPSNTKITGIKIIPYNNYTLNKGSFRMYNISLLGYNSTNTSINKYQAVSNAGDTLRHNIVNNMLEEATIKWNLKKTNPQISLYYYHRFNSNPIKLDSGTNTILYGMPYVNAIDATIYSFIDQTTINKITDSNKNKVPYFSYPLSTTYKKTVETNHGKTYTEGSPILNNTLYIWEKRNSTDSKENSTRKKDLEDTNLNFIDNSGYYYGVDCSSSTSLAITKEIPNDHLLNNSYLYYTSGEVKMIGGLSMTLSDVEKYLRKNGKIDKNTFFTDELMDSYYGEYMRQKYTDQKIFNSYGLLIPGDIVDIRGHVRMSSGYSHVECNDGTKTDKYKENFCSSHGGINGEKSYVIITEVGDRHSYRANTDSKVHILESKTGWTYKLNSLLTDLKSVDELYDSNNNLLSIFHINNKYTFSQLYNKNGSDIYLPFRVVALEKATNSNKVVVPTAKLAFDKEYSNLDSLSQSIYNELVDNKKLKGTIITNYLIEAIKIQINKKTFYIYPNQNKTFSLYTDITDQDIINEISKLDYTKTNKIIISVKTGPQIESVRKASSADENRYITILDTTNSKVPVKSTGITLDKTTLTIKVGEKSKVNATISPSNTTDKRVEWLSSGEKIATVDSNGNISGLKAGTVTITAKTIDTGKTATVKVSVVVPVTGIKLNKETTTIKLGQAEKITATLSPSTASNKKVIWSSSDSKIAVVDQTGTIKAVAIGTATITAKTDDGGKRATVKVTVNPILVEGITLNKKETSINLGQSEKITATISPNNATDKTIVWSSSDTKVAIVDSEGTIKTVGVGTTIITATTNSANKKATVKVTVQPVKVSGVKLNKTTTTININESETLVATISPTKATNKQVKWTSSNNSIVTVDSKGIIKGIKEGTADVTVETVDSAKKAKITVTVVKPTIKVSGIKLNKGSTSIVVGNKETITATILPNDATNKSIVWSTSDKNIVTVDSNGEVKGIKEGTATITAKTNDGGKIATVKVTVTKVSVTELKLSKTTSSIEKGKTVKITATVSPTNATYKKVNWTSSDTTIATVDSSGNIKGIKEGIATITAKTEKGEKTATVKVTISNPIVHVESVNVDKKNATLDKGEELLLNYTIMPINSDNREVNWSSNNENVVKVDSSGMLHALNEGIATITAKTADGGKIATVSVTVKNDVVEIVEPELPLSSEDNLIETIEKDTFIEESSEKTIQYVSNKAEDKDIKPESIVEELPKEEQQQQKERLAEEYKETDEQEEKNNNYIYIPIITLIGIVGFILLKLKLKKNNKIVKMNI